MPTDEIRYDLLTQDALRGVMRTVLADAASKGLPGNHHFYITFDTRAEGVRISPRLKADFPTEMTIVLQHQFWELKVGADHFDVGLAFGRVPERLHVPFTAVKTFMDPSVQFGLQFPVAVDDDAEEQQSAADVPDDPPSSVADAPHDGSETTPPAPEAAEAPREEGAEVVRLDRFRKK